MVNRLIVNTEDNVADLRLKLNEAEKVISELRNEIFDLEKNFELRLFNTSDLLINEFNKSLKFNPHRVNFSKKEQYDISVSDVLWISSKGRLKKIYLKRKIATVSKDKETDLIYSNDDLVNFEALISKIDLSTFCLTRVSRQFAVNVAYFKLNGTSLDLKINREINHKIPEIKITKSNIDRFLEKKEKLNKLLLFQKRVVRSNL